MNEALVVSEAVAPPLFPLPLNLSGWRGGERKGEQLWYLLYGLQSCMKDIHWPADEFRAHGNVELWHAGLLVSSESSQHMQHIANRGV